VLRLIKVVVASSRVGGGARGRSSKGGIDEEEASVYVEILRGVALVGLGGGDAIGKEGVVGFQAQRRVHESAGGKKGWSVQALGATFFLLLLLLLCLQLI